MFKSVGPSFYGFFVFITVLINLSAFYSFGDEIYGNLTINDNATIITDPKSSIGVLPSAKVDAEKEQKNSLAIFFILIIIVLSVLLVHVLLVTKFRYIPDSLSIIFLGSMVGLFLYITGADWRNEEAFSPNAFFLLLLPPIIFESGYNLHKGNFFANIFSILVFAVIGTAISAVVIGGGIYILGQAELIYSLSIVDSFAFGSLISAVDPVATLAIFQAIKLDQMLYMLVFGESMLNDAVSIVLTTAILELKKFTYQSGTGFEALLSLIGRFCAMFFGSAFVGILTGLASALLLKYVNLHNTPSLEYGIMLVFAYLPYSFTEGVHLSGIMAILFCGIVMSHYTHYNLSAVTQVTVQQTFRTLSFIAEACVFAYLGMAPFTFSMLFYPAFISWSIILCLIARAVNIFPLSFLVNFFREHKITKKMQFLMWFSGLRGAIAFALSLHTDFNDPKTRRIIVSTTYCVVLFTTIVLGGATMPLTSYLSKPKSSKHKRNRRKRRKDSNARKTSSLGLTLSKTIEMGSTVESYSELTEPECYYGYGYSTKKSGQTGNDVINGGSRVQRTLSGLARIDAQYLRPFFIRKFTQQEKKANTSKLADLAFQWYKDVVQQEDDGNENSDPEAEADLECSDIDESECNLNHLESESGLNLERESVLSMNTMMNHEKFLRNNKVNKNHVTNGTSDKTKTNNGNCLPEDEISLISNDKP